MGCASSTLNPLAGRNAVTHAASQRKKAAKDILVADKAFAKTYVAYYEHMRLVGSSLGAYFEQEDVALHSGPLAQMSNHYISADSYHTQTAPNTNDQLTPGQHTPSPVPSGGGGGLGMPVEPQTPPQGGARGAGTGGGWSTDGTTFHYPEAFAAEADEAYKAKEGGTPMASNADSDKPAPPADMPPQLPVGPRGAGLAGMGRQLNQLFLETAEAVRPAREQIVAGLDKNYSALPPLPLHLNGPPVMDKAYPTPQQTLWEALSILVAYEKQRSKRVKAMEQAKWDFSRYSRKLNRQSSKKVKVSMAAKQQQKINDAHQKMQSEQDRIGRLAQSVEGVSYNIENIKNGMVLPLLRQLLPTLAAANSRLAMLHDQQRQVIANLLKDGQLSLRVVPGATVLFTTLAHHKDMENLQTVLVMWEEAFSAQLAAQKHLLTSIILWLKKVHPEGGASLPDPSQGPPIPLPPTPSGQLMLPAPPTPEDGEATPVQPHPPPPNQLMVVNQPGHLVSVAPPQEMMGQFFEGGMPAVGEPLLALCYDWLRALDKLPALAVKEAIAAYGMWVKEAYEKQGVELKQLKVLPVLKRNADRAEHKYESLLKRERDYRANLKSPYSGPMSKTLSAILAPLATSGYLSPQLLLQGPDTPGGSQVPTPGSEPVVHPNPSNVPQPEEASPLDKAGMKAQKAEDAKELKAFQCGKDVDLAKGVWEGLKVKCLEEGGSLQVMAVEAHQAVIAGVEKRLEDVFKAMSAFDVLQSQMYSMLKFQHAHWL